MTGLARQSIKKLCDPTHTERPMIEPFRDHSEIINGMSGGLSCASYDLHIAHDLVLGVHPGELIAKHLLHYGDFRGITELRTTLYTNPPFRSIAHTIEDFDIPTQVRSTIADKSTYARMFVTALHTFFDPGFRGNCTLELINLGPEPVVYKAGDPVCQMLFEWLDVPTDKPYAGKFQNQARGEAHGPRYQNQDGTYTEEPPNSVRRQLKAVLDEPNALELGAASRRAGPEGNY